MKKLDALAGIAAAFGLSAVAAAPAGADRGSYNNWHVHDGGSGVDAGACGLSGDGRGLLV
jgi:Spy/CpxP family protein refolding chaperone